MPALIPADATFAFWSTDIEDLKKAATESPYGQLYNDPANEALRKYVDNAIQEAIEQEDPEAGARLKEAVELAKGGLAVYVTLIPDVPDDFNLTLITELDEAGKKWVEENSASFGKDMTEATRDTMTVNGVTVYRVRGNSGVIADSEIDAETTPADTEAAPEPTPAPVDSASALSWATVGDYLVMSSTDDEAHLTTAIGLLSGENKSSLLSRPEASTTASKHLAVFPNQFSFWIDVKTAIAQTVSNTSPDPEAMEKLSKTGLTDFNGLYGSVVLTPERIINQVTVTTPGGLTAVSDALFAKETLTLDTLKWAPEDNIGVGAFSFNFSTFYDAVLQVVEVYSPGTSSLINMPLLGLQSEFGVDLLGSVLRQIKGEHLIVTRKLDPELANALTPAERAVQTSQALHLSFESGNDVFNALKSLQTALSAHADYGKAFKAEEVDGNVIIRNAQPIGESPLQPVFSFNNKGLIISNNEVQLKESMRGMGNGNPIPAPLAAVVNAVDKSGLIWFSYNPKGALGHGLQQFRDVIGSGVFPMPEGTDASMVPSAEVVEKYIGDGYFTTHRREQSLEFETVLNGAGKSQ
jgi:hypothetical protein